MAAPTISRFLCKTIAPRPSPRISHCNAFGTSSGPTQWIPQPVRFFKAPVWANPPPGPASCRHHLSGLSRRMGPVSATSLRLRSAQGFYRPPVFSTAPCFSAIWHTLWKFVALLALSRPNHSRIEANGGRAPWPFLLRHAPPRQVHYALSGLTARPPGP